ncbi:tetratricopeptide repeat protein [Aneurinibacillus sp. REN35]|uniref:tetratricopeptide repeat protein n=1 Tax=Aneurinibacillus sp. REN35 TaxID=3237286 RepID=UPI003526C8D0
MKEKTAGKMRNIVFYVLLSTLFAGVITSIILGEKQDKRFAQDSQLFNQANNELKQGNFSKSESVYNQLITKHSNSYILLWRYALSLSGQGKYKEANQYFLKAREIRPFLLRNPQFLAQYGESLYRSGDYKKAERYLIESQKISIQAGSPSSPVIEAILLDTQKKLK